MIKTTLILWAVINGSMVPAKLPMPSPEVCEKNKAHFISAGDYIHVDCVSKEVKAKVSKIDKQEN